MKKIDIHVHTIRGEGINFYQPDKAARTKTIATPDEVVEIYKRLGIEKGVIMPLVNVEFGNRIQGNEDAMDIVKNYPDSFYWFCNIDPRMGLNSTKTDLSYFLEYYKDRGATGVGEVATNMYFDDPYMENLFYHCQKTRMPLLFHLGTRVGESYGIVDDVGLPHLEKELAKFPDLALIGHSPAFWCNLSADMTAEHWVEWYYPTGKVTPGRIVELMHKYPNLYGDISAWSGYCAIIRDPEFSYDFLEEFQNQILFGTDISSKDFNVGTSFWLDDALKNGKISEKAYQKISRDNALRLFEGK